MRSAGLSTKEIEHKLGIYTHSESFFYVFLKLDGFKASKVERTIFLLARKLQEVRRNRDLNSRTQILPAKLVNARPFFSKFSFMQLGFNSFNEIESSEIDM